MMSTTTERGLFIGGEWRAGNGDARDVVDPATEQTLAEVQGASDRDVDDAVAAARAAQRAWQRLPARERAAHVRQMADVLEAHGERIAGLLVAEVGKPLSEARGEVAFAVEYARYAAEWARRIEGDIVPSDFPDEAIHLERVPVGVVGAICPWNFPIALYFRKIAPALTTGNTVVLKPSEETPLSSLALTQLIEEQCALPAGVLNVVTGDAAVGRALVGHPSVDMITMTGHRDTGKKVMADAARNLTRVSLELGGKAPAIVLRDADMAMAVEAIVTARHTNAGQVCTCAERVFVEQAVFDEFVDAYATRATALQVGPPSGEVDLGPLVSRAQADKAAAAVARAVEEGASIVAGGGRPDGGDFSRGFWFAPTVLTGVQPEMDVMTEEVFGPVTPIMAVDSMEEALQHANASRYGLSAYVFSSDYSSVQRAVRDLDFGEIYVNRTHGESVQAHHGGFHESGIGGEDGKYGMLKYTQLKTIYHRFG
jgi:lactaldehyde dehydrogenase / glycolaldehyde dehydrogenase